MIDLTRFCDASDVRANLRAPWSRGGYSYATDGHILFRVPRREDVPEREDAPDLSKLDAEWNGKTYAPLPAIPNSLIKTCDLCRGKGRIVECKTCDGDGAIECSECGHERECPDCDGAGAWPAMPGQESVICWRCVGMGRKATFDAAALSPTRSFDPNYLLMLAELPGLAFSIDAAAPDARGASHFTFEGGDGLLMPRLPDSADLVLYAQEQAAA